MSPMDNTARLLATEEIKSLKSKYFYYLDAKDWNGWRTEVLSVDCTLVSQGMAEDVIRGSEDIIQFAEAVIGRAVTVHHGFTPDIAISTPEFARGVWAMEDRIYWPDDQRYQGLYSSLHGFGHYHETYRREPSGWRISAISLTRLHVSLS